jgi:hypothetical protein
MKLCAVALALATACYGPRVPEGAPCVTSSSCPATQTCVAGACRVGSSIDASGVATDSPADVAMTPASCNAILIANPAAPSGSYVIEGGVDVYCDMVAAGGGWTVVFLAPSSNLSALPIAYTSAPPQLLATATDALMAYRDATELALSNAASFALPAAWRTDTPFDAPDIDAPIDVSIDGATPVAGTLHFGIGNFNTQCGDPWIDGSYGRVCIEGTTAPFYSGFDVGVSDLCSDSQSSFNAAECSASLQFSIAVR